MTVRTKSTHLLWFVWISWALRCQGKCPLDVNRPLTWFVSLQLCISQRVDSYYPQSLKRTKDRCLMVRSEKAYAKHAVYSPNSYPWRIESYDASDESKMCASCDAATYKGISSEYLSSSIIELSGMRWNLVCSSLDTFTVWQWACSCNFVYTSSPRQS